jgi:hypothetical protein
MEDASFRRSEKLFWKKAGRKTKKVAPQGFCCAWICPEKLFRRQHPASYREGTDKADKGFAAIARASGRQRFQLPSG